ncbi:LexA family protein [Megasphaera massiliensis]|uniref:LexA family protein n=2 Tax=Megasphaera massiliensis TaxID=1232428 RepID=UPI0005CAC905|nr:XRE family transcriptional regulator [Megasphaera massiliensis]
MKSIGEKIKEARKLAKMTQVELAKAVDLSRSYIGDIEKDRYNPSITTLRLIANATGVPLESLLSSADQRPAGRGIRIPVLGRVVAGVPIEAVEEILDYEEITPALAATGDFFALQVRGDSMQPKLEEGDIVIVKQQEDVESGDIAIVLVNGNDATIKQVKKLEGGIMLYGFNPDVYEPHFYSNQQIIDLPVRILGKVIESRRAW